MLLGALLLDVSRVRSWISQARHGWRVGAAEWRGDAVRVVADRWFEPDLPRLLRRVGQRARFADGRECGRWFPGQTGAAGRRPPAPPAGDRRRLGVATPVACGPDRRLQGPPG